jgi:hypothetical protein
MDDFRAIIASGDASVGGFRLYGRAVSINSGAFAFLTVPTQQQGSECVVEVVHCTKEFILPMGQTAGPLDNAVGQSLVFVGETQAQQLPRVLMQPSDGLDEAVTPAEVYIPSSDAIAAFYASKDSDDVKSYDLLPRRTGAAIARGHLSKWTFLPTAFIPRLIDGLPPRVVWERVRQMVAGLSDAQIAKFGPLLQWTRAACMQQGGTGHQRAWSQMAIPWRTPRMTAPLTNWAVRQMRSHYPEVFNGAATQHPTATSGQAGFDSTSMRDAIRDGISAGAATMATVLRPLEEARSRKDKWTEIQKEAILKACGFLSTTEWDYEDRPSIWDVYEEEGCKPQDIIRVFRKEFNPDADNVTTDIVEPFITLHLAKDI